MAAYASTDSSSSNPFDYFAIHNVISDYCLALDTKNFKLLTEGVFTEDVDAVYPFFTVKGAQDVADRIEKRLAPVTSQHALTTQKIVIATDGKSAEATTYFTGIHFGQGKWSGQQVTAWGKYVDTLICVNAEPSLPSASGTWRISRRETAFMGRLGEEGVMEGE